MSKPDYTNTDLNPRNCHNHLMNNMKPELHYTGQPVKAWQEQLRTKLTELLGLSEMPRERCPLNVRSQWKRNHDYGTIEKIIFTSEPHCDVSAYVCIPHKVKPPYPFFVCLQGHSTGMHNSIGVEFEDESIPKEIAGDRDFGIVCMKRGVAAICIEQRAFGEREDTSTDLCRCHNPAMQAIMLGRTLLGERIYDVDRAIDYLAARGDVDMTKVGVMGNSGGGTVSMFAGGLLDRLSYVMPSCSFSTFKASIMSIDHCLCNFVPNLLKYAESSDVVALAAPKPLVIVNGDVDPIFPLEDAKQAFADIKTIYQAIGAEEHCHHVIADGGHRFYADDAWPIMLSELNMKNADA